MCTYNLNLGWIRSNSTTEKMVSMQPKKSDSHAHDGNENFNISLLTYNRGSLFSLFVLSFFGSSNGIMMFPTLQTS